MKEKSVLIVDDEQVLIDLVKECLEDDFDIQDCAKSVDVARDLLLGRTYDCILIDIDLKGQNGAELVKFIADYDPSGNSETPVVLMSGHINEDFKNRHGEKFAGILTKPFKKGDLQATVLIALGKAKRVKKRGAEINLFAESKDSVAKSDILEQQVEKVEEKKIKLSLQVGEQSVEVDVFDPKVMAPFKVKDIEKRVGKFLSKVKKNPKLKDLFKSINLKSDDPYMMTHIGLLINISTGISTKLEWASEQTLEKFIFSSYLHDLSLGNSHQLAKFSTLDEIMSDDSLSDDEKKLAQYHPQASAKLFEHKKDIPMDVQEIVSQHHERPDGSGFPLGLTHKRITPLSSIFIVSHLLVDYIFDHPNWKIEMFIEAYKPKLKGPHFRKIFQALQTMK